MSAPIALMFHRCSRPICTKSANCCRLSQCTNAPQEDPIECLVDYLNENAQTNVTSEAKAKFRNPFDRLEAGQSLIISKSLLVNH